MDCVIGVPVIVKIHKPVTIFDGDFPEFSEAFEELLDVAFTNIAS